MLTIKRAGQANSLISKLTLLTLHFPRLRLIWSRSLHASADLFRALKSNQDDPDPLVAASVGEPPHLQLTQGLSAEIAFAGLPQAPSWQGTKPLTCALCGSVLLSFKGHVSSAYSRWIMKLWTLGDINNHKLGA